jgi:hypothetical protein
MSWQRLGLHGSSQSRQTIGQTVQENVCAAETGHLCCYGSRAHLKASAKVLGTLGDCAAATRG